MSGVDFSSIKTAIHNWVVAASGLAGDHVVWSPLRDTRGNPIPRPVGTFVSLSIPGLRSPGFDDNPKYTVNDAGDTFTQSLLGPRILILFVQVFQGSPTGADDVGALSLLNDILAGAAKDSIALALSTAKVAIGTYDDAQHVPAKYNDAKQELRAFSTVKIFVGSKLAFATAASAGGWISNVNSTGTITSELGTETVTVSVTDT